MNIKSTLTALLSIYESSRQAGHTTAAIDGVGFTNRAVLICENHSQARRLRPLLPEHGALALSQLENLRDRRAPIVLDNAAVVFLAQGALHEIERLEAASAKMERERDYFRRLVEIETRAADSLRRKVHALELENAKLRADKLQLLREAANDDNKLRRLKVEVYELNQRITWLKLPLWKKALHRAWKYLLNLRAEYARTSRS